MTMDIRLPTPKSAARILKTAMKEVGLGASHGQCLDLVAKIYGYNDWHAMQKDDRFTDPGILKAESSSDYAMPPTAGSSCWIGVGRLAVYIRVSRDGDGVAVDLLPNGSEMDDALDSAFASFADAETDPFAIDPARPFWNSRLPEDIQAVLFHPADGEPVRCPVTECLGCLLTWLEEGGATNDFDFSEDVVTYRRPDGTTGALDGQMLVNATLTAEGMFTLADGRRLSLVDGFGAIWTPTTRRG